MSLKEKIVKLKKENPDFGYQKIADILGCNSGTVRFHVNPKYRSDIMEARNLRRRDRKKRLIEFSGGECQICGYSKCHEALDFHHKDPDFKEYLMKDMASYTDKRAFEEVKKCILLCCRCHREVHAGFTKLS